MKKFLGKIVGLALIGSTVITSSAWEGTDVIGSVHKKINDQNNIVELFATNEQKLKNGIEDYKKQIDSIKNDIDKMGIDNKKLNDKIDVLYSHIEKSEIEKSNIININNKTNKELDKANKDVIEFGEFVNDLYNNFLKNKPMSEEELNELLK